MSRSTWIAVAALTFTLSGAGAALAERVPLEHTTLSFERPPTSYEECGAWRPCVRAQSAPPGIAYYFPVRSPGTDARPKNLPIISLFELPRGIYATAEAYAAIVTATGEPILRKRAVKLGGIPAIEFASKRPGYDYWGSRVWPEVSHMFVFESQGKVYGCHLIVNAEAYDSSLEDFNRFCNSVRDDAGEVAKLPEREVAKFHVSGIPASVTLDSHIPSQLKDPSNPDAGSLEVLFQFSPDESSKTFRRFLKDSRMQREEWNLRVSLWVLLDGGESLPLRHTIGPSSAVPPRGYFYDFRFDYPFPSMANIKGISLRINDQLFAFRYPEEFENITSCDGDASPCRRNEVDSNKKPKIGGK